MHKFWLLFYALFLLSCTREEVIDVWIEKESPFKFNKKEDCKVGYLNHDSVEFHNAVIKLRGGYSSKFPKRSFSLELNKKTTFANLPKDDDWIINANYIDKTFMRHKISFDLFRAMGAYNKAAQCAFANVYLNGEYNGLYVLMEEINGGMLKLDKKDSMAMIFKDPPVFRTEKLAYVQEPGNYYQQKYPKKSKSDKTEYLESFIDFLFNASDAQFVKEVSNWVDMENIMDWHILLLFSNNGDGMLKNFYLYKLNKDTPFRIAIWDYDHSFGRDGDNERNMLERVLDCNKVVLLKRLMEIPECAYSANLQSRWEQLRWKKIISVRSFQKRMKKMDKTIKEDLPANFEKWPVSSTNYYDANTYEQELELMQEFVALRIQQLDEYFAAM